MQRLVVFFTTLVTSEGWTVLKLVDQVIKVVGFEERTVLKLVDQLVGVGFLQRLVVTVVVVAGGRTDVERIDEAVDEVRRVDEAVDDERRVEWTVEVE